MKISLKQIIDTFETFGKNHKGIKKCETNPITKLTSKGYLYPLMWIQLTGANLEAGQTTINLTIHFVDKLKSNYNNFVKVVSDTLKLCEDTLAYFYEYEEDFNFTVTNDSSIQPVEYAFDDNVAGNKMDITIQVQNNYSQNEVAI